jgi:hypothetical protein
MGLACCILGWEIDVEVADIDLQMLVEAGILDNLVGLVSRAKTDSVKLDDLVVISLLLEHGVYYT